MSQSPTYSEVYMSAKAEEPGAFEVRYHTEDGYYTGYLRRANFKEVIDTYVAAYAAGFDDESTPSVYDRVDIYIRVEHPLTYPYAKWDCEEANPNAVTKWLPKHKPREPYRFQQAALVFTPKLGLM